MKIFKINSIKVALLLIASISIFASCSESKSYAQLLDDERKSTNAYLATQKVVTTIPADSIFETGVNAPYYRITEDGNVYMQVIKAGDRKNNKAVKDQQIFFRFMRISLTTWASGGNPLPEGNANDVSYNPLSFRYQNYSLSSSTQFGTGLQLPLNFLGIDCEVNLIIRSQYGFTSEISNVTPYLYQNVRYYKSQI